MNKKLKFVFLASFIFWCHMALITYVNSSLLESYVSPGVTSLLFALGSGLNIIWILILPKMVNRFGVVNISTSLIFIGAILCALVGLANAPMILLPIFVLFFSTSTAIIYTLDILVEHHSKDEITGGIRGLLLTINNFAMALLPLFVGILTEKYGFKATYLLAATVLAISGITILSTQRKMPHTKTELPNLKEAIKNILQNKALKRIITINFLLQFFYAWMVIYTPLYLANELGFDWSTIGIILSVMLAPFVIFQLPAGRIADKWLGEKEMLISALLIAGASTIAFAVLPTPTATIVAITLFCTRIGASIVEVMCDSYFFKQIDATNVNIISFYRIMYPISYILGPILGAIILWFTNYQTFFITLGFILILGALYAIKIVDTK